MWNGQSERERKKGKKEIEKVLETDLDVAKQENVKQNV